MTKTSSADFFEAKYQAKSDPWNFSGSAYEQDRYQSILEILDAQTYHYAFEPGCSIGILTQELAARCDFVEALDFSETAVQLAKTRCKDLNNVTVIKASLKKYSPAQQPDLIILSEIGYYFSLAEWNEILENLLADCMHPATIIACHWLGQSEDHVLSGDAVHESIDQHSTLKLIMRLRFDHFRLDRWDLLK
jgi:trans-aconitate methyltransferase